MPDVCTDDVDISAILDKNPNATIYYPVFCGSTGWWGELLGGDAVVSDKLISNQIKTPNRTARHNCWRRKYIRPADSLKR